MALRTVAAMVHAGRIDVNLGAGQAVEGADPEQQPQEEPEPAAAREPQLSVRAAARMLSLVSQIRERVTEQVSVRGPVHMAVSAPPPPTPHP